MISNGLKRFQIHDTRKWLRVRRASIVIEDSAPTIYLYHHLFKRPFKKSHNCNHFAYLEHIESLNEHDVYENDLPSDEEPVPLPVEISSEEEHTTKMQLPPRKRCKTKNTDGTKQKNIAEMKQKTMMRFLGKMKVNKESVANIEASRKAVKELDIEMECCSAIDQIISCLELKETTSNRCTVQNVKKGRNELHWTSCSAIIYFYLYPALGRKDLV